MDIVLRLFVLTCCLFLIVLACRTALWTVEPWYRATFGRDAGFAVAIDPISFAEGGKLDQSKGDPAARALSRRLQRINEQLRRDQSREYAQIQRTSSVRLPDASAPELVRFDPFTAERVTFEAKVFNVDIVGIGTFLYRQLYRGDIVRVMMKLAPASSRYFIEVARPERSGNERQLQLDGTVATGDVHAVLDQVACRVAWLYHGRHGRFSGLPPEGFCDLLDVLEQSQDFVSTTASNLSGGGTLDQERLAALVTQLQRPTLHDSPAVVPGLILAGLHRLGGDQRAALAALEEVARLDPGNSFVRAHLERWRDEQAQLAASQAEARAIATAPQADAEALAQRYAELRAQPALLAIGHPAAVAAARGSRHVRPLLVAVLSTGYTPGAAPPGDGARILEPVNLIEGETGLDGNGHGTEVTNLMAALIPFEEVAIQPIKVLSDSGAGQDSSILQGLDLAAERGAKLIIAPLGRPPAAGGEPIYSAATEALERRGALMLAAAGNDARRPDHAGSVNMPAILPLAVAVGATDPSGDIARFSPGPDGIDVFAPGVDIVSLNARAEPVKRAGSSFSTAIAGGVTALALATAADDIDNPTLRDRLAASARPIAAGGPSVLQADGLQQLLAAPAAAQATDPARP